jgi:hypothetical protein
MNVTPTWKLSLLPAFTLAYSLNLKTEATFSPETSVDFQRITRRYIPEDRTLHPYMFVAFTSHGNRFFQSRPPK